MRSYLAIVLISTVFPASFFAQSVIHVNNTGATVGVDYPSLSAAVIAAQPGDTLYVYPSSIFYENITVDKKLIIIGPGYDVDVNPSLGITTYRENSLVDQITITAGADGTIVTGMRIDRMTANGVDNILFQGNRITSYINITTSANAQIISNLFTAGSEANNQHHLELVACNNSMIKNNLFSGWEVITNCPNDQDNDNLLIDQSVGILVENNAFRDRVRANNCILRNNIFFYNTTASGCKNPIAGNNLTIQHNVFVYNSQFGDTTNVAGVADTEIFVGFPSQGDYSFDGRFQLKANSPAIGVGLDGIDCGVFAGITPYKLSGIPPIPVIYQIEAPTSATGATGLDITIKVRSEN